MYTRPTNPSPQLLTVLNWFDAITRWDFDTLASLLSDDYVHSTLPASAGDPDKNKEEGIAHAKVSAQMLGGQHLNLEIYDVNEGEQKIWAHYADVFLHTFQKTRLYAKPPSGLTYDSESIFLFTLSPQKDGQLKISVIKDFVDTKTMADLLASAIKGSDGEN
ncbi:hypothetical protein EW146_g7215 [Bondarzewia mesenterica]|uniref:SnoaL-like domain-containing protein n=1 Tax=Bondarzewia mesenterica TaxID=1095465 RepID=A0A4S4LM08_9AGAM|nr:hypothetical protein EW146_g7215 [Bondarzewia mesenterica]